MQSIGGNGAIVMKNNLLRIALVVILAAAIAVALAYRDQIDVAAVDDWVRSKGFVAPLFFMGLYVLATVLFLPGSALSFAGGALFGPVWGTLYNLTGATIGATIAFMISRYLMSDWVARKAGGRTKQLVKGVEAEGWRFVAFVRLVPLFPFNLLNYALGLTRIKVGHYALASYLAMLPGCITITYVGYAGREVLAGGEGLLQKGMLGLALLAAGLLLPKLISRIRKGGSVVTEEK